MNRFQKTVAGLTVAGSMLLGGVAGAVIYAATVIPAAAASPSPTPSSSSPSGSATTPSGKFVPNETAAHEATESAAREAQENAGQVPTVP